MKKCYNFLMVLATIVLCLGVNFASAQTVILSENFDAVTGGNSNNTNTQCYAGSGTITNGLDTILPGWSGEWVYPAIGKVKLGKKSNNACVSGYLQLDTIDLTAYESVRIAFQAKSWNGSDPTTMTVYVDTIAYEITGLPNTGSSDAEACDLADFSIIAAGGAVRAIRFESDCRMFLDNVVITSATDPMLVTQGTTNFSNLSVNQEVSGSVTVKGYNLPADTTVAVVMVGDTLFSTPVTTLTTDTLMSENGVTVPFTFSAPAAGNYAATMLFINDELFDTVRVALTANVVSINEISTIAGLRALINTSNVEAHTTDSVFYKYTGHAYITVVGRPKDNVIQSKWMQDSTGAIQLYDPTGLLANVNQGVEITNVVGWVENYFGYAEFNVKAGIANSDINAFPTTIPAPITITLAQLHDQTYMDSIQGQLVRMENVTFDQTGTFDRLNFYTVTENGTSDTACYFPTNYHPLSTTEIPTTAVNIIGVNWRTSVQLTSNAQGPRLPSRYFIIPSKLEPVTGISENGKTSIIVYPNPTADNVTLTIDGDATTVSVYNMMGARVSTQSVSYGANTVNMSSMPAGVYFLRITNGNEAVGTVKVVRQ